MDVLLVQNYVITTIAQVREVVRARRPTPMVSRARQNPVVLAAYDLDARWAAKGDDVAWNGYKVHITETCCDPADPTPAGADTTGRNAAGRNAGGERPNIITGVATTDATVPDAAMTEPIHATLAGRELLPAQHYLDSGYPSAALVVDSLHRWGVSLVTPLLADQSPQARAGAGYDRASFTIDFDARQATCPQGQASTWWNPQSPNAAPTPS